MGRWKPGRYRSDSSNLRRPKLTPVDAPVRREVSTDRPALIDVNGSLAPASPSSLELCGVPAEFLADLALKIVHPTPHFTTDWVAGQLRLPRSLSADLLERLMIDRLIEVVGQDGLLSYRWAITDKGRQRAARLLDICGYIGPAPVAIDTYNAMIHWQCDHLPDVKPSDIAIATDSLVLPKQVIEIAGLAALSRRSLFLYGPPGNGKTTIGRLLHNVLRGELWVPHSVMVGNDVIRVFDPQVHDDEPIEASREELSRIDNRWVRVQRPFVVAAGELMVEDLDLAYSQALGYYEAPLHMKANGGIFMLDDFGYQRANPFQLLNRWVFPLEHNVDFLTLKSGQKLFVPFRQMLIVSTNLDPESVMEPAILRRIGYRLYMGNPTPQQYAEIFERYAACYGIEAPPDMIDRLLERHEREDRPLRGCVPRDLINRVRDICKFRGHPMDLTDELLDTAWFGYFGADINGNGSEWT